MSWDTLRGNKMRSALTVLGIVIGITSIVGMTSLIRGFDESFTRLDQADRPEHDLRRRSSRASACRRGADFQDHAEAAEHHAGRRRSDRARRAVDRGRRHHARRRRPGGGRPSASTTATSGRSRSLVVGTTEQLAVRRPAAVETGRFFNARRGAAAAERGRPRPDRRTGAVPEPRSDRQEVRSGSDQYK